MTCEEAIEEARRRFECKGTLEFIHPTTLIHTDSIHMGWSKNPGPIKGYWISCMVYIPNTETEKKEQTNG